MPWATKIYKRDMDVTKYNVPFLLHPYIALYSTRGCPAQCTFCLWPRPSVATPGASGPPMTSPPSSSGPRKTSPGQGILLRRRHFNIQKARTIELCSKLKPLGITWSCTSRVTTEYETLKAMKEAGCRLLIVGFESGDPQILKNIKKGATVERARQFAKTVTTSASSFTPTSSSPARRNQGVDPQHHQLCENSGLRNHPGQRRPRLSWHRVLRLCKANGYITNERMEDGGGHQMAHIEYPGLPVDYVMEMVHKFYDEYYFRPRQHSACVEAVVNRDVPRSTSKPNLHEAARAAQQGVRHAGPPSGPVTPAKAGA